MDQINSVKFLINSLNKEENTISQKLTLSLHTWKNRKKKRKNNQRRNRIKIMKSVLFLEYLKNI